jgi:rubrerythrin
MKKIIKSNPKIVVEIKTRIYGIELSKETQKHDLMQAKEQIKRHVDNVEDVRIEYDTDEVCSFCNYNWEVSEDDSDPDFPKGCPVCCQDAIDEWNKNK